MKRVAALVSALLVPLGVAWQDCDSAPPQFRGQFKPSAVQNVTHQGHSIYLQYPLDALPAGASGWPTVIFMHGMTLGWEWYARQVEHLVSHGLAVAFPFVKGTEKDDGFLPIPVTETDSMSIYVAADYLRNSLPAQMPKMDLDNLALVGHSMGGEDTIRAAAGVRVPKGMAPMPHGSVKVAIAQHPSLCTFPPPYPASINKAEIEGASKNATLLVFTAENDRAFLPGTPSKEYNCWQAATGPALFASFKKTVCETYPPCSSMTGAGTCALKIAAFGVGHMCPCDAPGMDTWTSPELKWVTTALRLHLQQGGAQSSACHDLLVGDSPGSFKHSPDVAKVEMHLPDAAVDQILV